MRREMKDAFLKEDTSRVVRLANNFGPPKCSVWSVFKDERGKVVAEMVGPKLVGIETLAGQMYERCLPILRVMEETKISLPKTLATPMGFVLNVYLRDRLERKNSIGF